LAALNADRRWLVLARHSQALAAAYDPRGPDFVMEADVPWTRF
jgi:hypothetical protein